MFALTSKNNGTKKDKEQSNFVKKIIMEFVHLVEITRGNCIDEILYIL